MAIEEHEYRVADIHCDGCEDTIRRALFELDGVEDVRPDSAAGRVLVRFDAETVDSTAIAQRLAEAGFPVTETTTISRDRPAGDHATASQSGGERYALLAAAVGAVAVAAYAGYLVYPRFDLPAAEGAGLLALAAGAGIASFFSPCSFPLLVALLARQTSARREARGGPPPAVFGAALAVGAASFLLLLGVAVAAGGEALFAGVTFTSTPGVILRATVGTVLVILGLSQIGIVPLPFRKADTWSVPLARANARLRRTHPVAGFALYGFGYVLAGFG